MESSISRKYNAQLVWIIGKADKGSYQCQHQPKSETLQGGLDTSPNEIQKWRPLMTLHARLSSVSVFIGILSTMSIIEMKLL